MYDRWRYHWCSRRHDQQTQSQPIWAQRLAFSQTDSIKINCFNIVWLQWQVSSLENIRSWVVGAESEGINRFSEWPSANWQLVSTPHAPITMYNQRLLEGVLTQQNHRWKDVQEHKITSNSETTTERTKPQKGGRKQRKEPRTCMTTGSNNSLKSGWPGVGPTCVGRPSSGTWPSSALIFWPHLEACLRMGIRTREGP